MLIDDEKGHKSAGSQWKLSIKSVLQVSLHSNPGTLSLGKSADGK